MGLSNTLGHFKIVVSNTMFFHDPRLLPSLYKVLKATSDPKQTNNPVPAVTNE